LSTRRADLRQLLNMEKVMSNQRARLEITLALVLSS
jgi:hypothetical protein